LKLGFLQVWAHKTNAAVFLTILEKINEKYKVIIQGPMEKMHLIELVKGKYISSNFNYVHTLKDIDSLDDVKDPKKVKKPKSAGRKKK